MRALYVLLSLYVLLYAHCEVACALDSVMTDSLEPQTTNNHTPNVAKSPIANKAIIEAVKCHSDEDCQEFHIDSGLTVICDLAIEICIVAKEKPTVVPPGPIETTTRADKGDEAPGIAPTTEDPLKVNATTSTTTPPPVNQIEPELYSIPVVVWVLFTIPFISIIILGIICGRRLKMQSDNIQENLLRTTINGVHVDQLLQQRAELGSAVASRPPPTYEKATGEIPPSYETVLQGLKEKRRSIFQSDNLMNSLESSYKNHNCDNRSFCSACSSVRSSQLSTANNTHRGSPLLYTISNNNFT